MNFTSFMGINSNLSTTRKGGGSSGGGGTRIVYVDRPASESKPSESKQLPKQAAQMSQIQAGLKQKDGQAGQAQQQQKTIEKFSQGEMKQHAKNDIERPVNTNDEEKEEGTK